MQIISGTSSWMAGGSAARNSGLTSVSPGPPSTGAVEGGTMGVPGGRVGGLMPSWFCSTSRRMSSGRAARNEGSTPSGRLMPNKKKQCNHDEMTFYLKKRNLHKTRAAVHFTCKWVFLIIASGWEGLFLDCLRLAVSTITPGHRFPR